MLLKNFLKFGPGDKKRVANCRQVIIDLTKHVSLSSGLLQQNSEVTMLIMGNKETG